MLQNKTMLLNLSTPLSRSKGQIQKYKLPLQTLAVHEGNRSRTCITGDRRKTFQSEKNARTVLLLGEAGAGKSTLIDGMVNYILGVEWEDDFRFTIVDHVGKGRERTRTKALSQAEWITTYVIPQQIGSRVHHEVWLVDVPGFGDANGRSKDKELMGRLKTLLSLPQNESGVTELDLACFIVQASQSRLTHTQDYILDAMRSIFDKSIAENIAFLITFADCSRPPVLETLKEKNILSTEVFKFNNAALFISNDKTHEDNDNVDSDDNGDFPKMFWEIGKKSFHEMFTKLQKKETKSLIHSREVLDKRDQIAAEVERLKKLTKKGISLLDEVRQKKKVFTEISDKIKANENFIFEVEVDTYDRKKLPSGQYITNCQSCCTSCHGRCTCSDLKSCMAMDRSPDPHCTVCTKKCHWQMHTRDCHEYIVSKKREIRTYEDMKKRYEQCLDKKGEILSVMDGLKREFYVTQKGFAQVLSTITQLINRLNEIALTGHSITQVEHLKLAIEAEQQKKEAGYRERIQMYNEALEEAETLEDIASANFNPWGQYFKNPHLMDIHVKEQEKRDLEAAKKAVEETT